MTLHVVTEVSASVVDDPSTPRSGLNAAVAYWPDRWPRAVVLAAIAMEQFIRPMYPAEWADLLDVLTADTAGVLRDSDTYAVLMDREPESSRSPR